MGLLARQGIESPGKISLIVSTVRETKLSSFAWPGGFAIRPLIVLALRSFFSVRSIVCK
jgi:hypothetical protein